MSAIKNQLKFIRKQHKLSQQELAQLIGVRRETIVHLENERYNPSLEMALKISEHFNCPIEDIFQLKKKVKTTVIKQSLM
ncbi:helix-turn-helix transcriptional regulator [Streptococcus suis]|nr:helix-turn-helix transcriptional regulator [Streptococcus suis]